MNDLYIDEITIQELYEWARNKGIENATIKVYDFCENRMNEAMEIHTIYDDNKIYIEIL